MVDIVTDDELWEVATNIKIIFQDYNQKELIKIDKYQFIIDITDLTGQLSWHHVIDFLDKTATKF